LGVKDDAREGYEAAGSIHTGSVTRKASGTWGAVREKLINLRV
jgi:hypothetical protein